MLEAGLQKNTESNQSSPSYAKNEAINMKNYERICSWSFDPTGIEEEFTFSKKLASKNDWSEDFTMQVIDQYRKFLCLLVSNIDCAPSKAVDEAWHEHILRTKNYFAFCKAFAGKYIHHQPTFTKKQQDQCSDIFSSMIQAYQHFFGQPLASIWQMNPRECANKCHSCRGKCMRMCTSRCSNSCKCSLI